MRLFKPLVEHLKLLTTSSDIITAITSFGGSSYEEGLLASMAERIIRIEHPSKNIIRLFDNGHVIEYMVPPGQMRFTDFTGGDAYGWNST